jgi:hypothetical protein
MIRNHPAFWPFLAIALLAANSVTAGDKPPPEDTTIVPFQIDIPDAVLQNLKDRLARVTLGICHAVEKLLG